MLPLLDEILAAKPTGVILTTYALSPTFFEYQFVSPLLAAGCLHVVLFCDRRGYQAIVCERAALARAGVDYWVVPVDMAPFAFHAKLCLMWSQSDVRLYVSSANLTKSGLGSNVEIVDRLVCRDGDTTYSPDIEEIVGFFRALNRRQPISRSAHNALDGIISQPSRSLASLRPGAEMAEPKNLHVLHNFDRELFEQLAEILPFEPREILAVSPFFDSDLSAVAKFAQQYPAASILVAQGPRGTGINPKVGSTLRQGIKPAVLHGFGNRFVHAKTLLFRGPGGSAVVTGSANLTLEAWGSKAGQGNFEAVVVRLSSNSRAFHRLFSEPVRIAPTKWKSLAYQPSSGGLPTPQPRIVWAETSGVLLHLILADIGTAEVKEIQLNTKAGRFHLQRRGTPEHKDGSIALTADVPSNCVGSLEYTATVAVCIKVSKSGTDVWVTALVVNPEDIGSPLAYKRARQAYDRVQQGDCDGEDVLALFAFVQNELSAVLAGTSSPEAGTESRSPTKNAPEPTAEQAACLGVLLESHEALSPDRPIGRSGGIPGLLEAVPRLFAALLRDSRSALPLPSIPLDQDSDEGDDDQAPPSAPGDSGGSDNMIIEAAKVLDWIAGRFDSQGLTSDAEAMVYILDFGLSLARYLYLFWKAPVEMGDGRAQLYLLFVRRLLRAALSAFGNIWGNPVGWFLRVPAVVRDSCATSLRRRNLPGRLLYHLSELTVNSGQNREQSLAEAKYILAGCEHLLHDRLERVDCSLETADNLRSDHGNVFLRDMSIGRLQDELERLRAIETPERIAETNFKPLVALRAVTRRCFELRRQIASTGSLQSQELQALNEKLTAAETDRVDQRRACDLHQAEMAVYDQFYRQGNWRFLEYLNWSATEYCPSQNTRLPTWAVSQLSDITKPVKCPSCSVLIIPFPEGALDLD
ncbi:MAG: hypothetical protein WB762_01520 [Candidatus Sulfotelmatobacter sp.]